MNESEMDNRVSKSVYTVKEQRVYGCYCLLFVFITMSIRQLRCTLMVYESRYQTGIPSNTLLTFSCSDLHKCTMGLRPFFVTGFADAEGSFMVKLQKGKLQPDFTIGLHIKDQRLLKSIHSFFGVGRFRVSGNYCYYSVKRVNDIVDVIISHFDQYPLQTQKKRDYLIFKQIVLMMKSKNHLTSDGMSKILDLKRGLN